MSTLAGVRVLIIEDEGPIALMLEVMLEDMGCIVAGSAGSVAQALARVATGGFDFALLDLNLRGINAAPVADALAAANIPFAFASGYGASGVPPHLKGTPVLQKPFTSDDLEKAIRESLRAGPKL